MVVIKTRSNYYFFSKKCTELEVCLHSILRACTITGASLQLCFSFFPHHSWRNPWSPSVCTCSTNINFARASTAVSGGWGNACFFSSTLFPAHTFLILILQLQVTHRMLTDTDLCGCGVIRSTRVLHTKLKRPRPEVIDWNPTRTRLTISIIDTNPYGSGRVPGPRVSGPPWRPLLQGTYF